MKPEKIFAITALLLLSASKSTFQQFAGCRESYFLHDGQCKSCPDRCATCISDLNCTACQGNYYGPICQYTCQQNCEDLCHKVHGYCTYGCPDGLFPEPNSPKCANCPAQCKICKSMTECAECIPGSHGNTCEKQCSSNCESCNKTTGACLVCNERYFNKDGQCHKCSDGCVSCYGTENCSRCEEGYLKIIDGQCIMECPMESIDASLTSIALEYIKSHCTDKMDSPVLEVKTKKPCIQYTSCSSNIMCPSAYNGHSGCGTIQHYECSHLYHLTNEGDAAFSHNCTITEQDRFVMTICVTNRETISDIMLSAESECFNVPVAEGPIDTPQPWVVPMEVLIALSLGLVCVAFILVVLLLRYRKPRRFRMKRVNIDEPTEEEHITKAHQERKKSQSETVSNHHSEEVL